MERPELLKSYDSVMRHWSRGRSRKAAVTVTRTANSIATFRSRHKTDLFAKAYVT